MTIAIFSAPPIYLLSREILTTAGTYNRTPPDGAAILIAGMRGAGGAIYCVPNQYGGAGSGAYLQGMLPLAGNDSFSIVVGLGGSVNQPDLNRYHVDGGGATKLARNGTAVMIAAGGAGASSYNGNVNVAGGSGGVSAGANGFCYDSGGYFHVGGAGGTQTSGGPQFNPDATLDGSGGYGLYPGSAAIFAGGGGSSFIDPSVTHTEKSAGGVAAGIGTAPGQPGYPGFRASPDLAVTVGQGAYFILGVGASQVANGNDGGIVLAWYTGDPYAAGLLS